MAFEYSPTITLGGGVVTDLVAQTMSSSNMSRRLQGTEARDLHARRTEIGNFWRNGIWYCSSILKQTHRQQVYPRVKVKARGRSTGFVAAKVIGERQVQYDSSLRQYVRRRRKLYNLDAETAGTTPFYYFFLKKKNNIERPNQGKIIQEKSLG